MGFVSYSGMLFWPQNTKIFSKKFSLLLLIQLNTALQFLNPLHSSHQPRKWYETSALWNLPVMTSDSHILQVPQGLSLPTNPNRRQKGDIYCTIVMYIKGRKWIKLTDKSRRPLHKIAFIVVRFAFVKVTLRTGSEPPGQIVLSVAALYLLYIFTTHQISFKNQKCFKSILDLYFFSPLTPVLPDFCCHLLLLL